jgi:hypothetical protein
MTGGNIGQCLDHLCVANDVYLAAMEKALSGRPRDVPIIFFTIGTGLEVLVRRRRRHLLQAERVRERGITNGPGRET